MVYINILAIVQLSKRTENIFLNPIILTKIPNFTKTEVSLVEETGTFVGYPLPKNVHFCIGNYDHDPYATCITYKYIILRTSKTLTETSFPERLNEIKHNV